MNSFQKSPKELDNGVLFMPAKNKFDKSFLLLKNNTKFFSFCFAYAFGQRDPSLLISVDPVSKTEDPQEDAIVVEIEMEEAETMQNEKWYCTYQVWLWNVYNIWQQMEKDTIKLLLRMKSKGSETQMTLLKDWFDNVPLDAKWTLETLHALNVHMIHNKIEDCLTECLQEEPVLDSKETPNP